MKKQHRSAAWGVKSLALLAALSSGAFSARAVTLPSQTVPENMGINIHFTTPRAGEMKMLRESGARFVRMDLVWADTEKQPGIYDFSAYDTLMNELSAHGMKAFFILDYGNPLYNNGAPPRDAASRDAFAQWAAAAVNHFRGRGIVWEIWNEPNGTGFWPNPDPVAYTELVKVAAPAIRAVAPEEIIVGPALAAIDLSYLESAFKAGLLNHLDAVTVHPYRGSSPETAESDYRIVRDLIAKYGPAGKTIPVWSGEWGYNTSTKGISEETQGKYLPRQVLSNTANDIGFSTWYDWRNDGPDPQEPEHNFGTVGNTYFEGRDPVYDPKPSYNALKTLTSTLDGFSFVKRLHVGSAQDYVLLYARGGEVRLVAWTTGAAHDVVISASAGLFDVRDHLGNAAAPVSATTAGLSLALSDAPRYYIPQAPNDALRVAAAWAKAPLELRVLAPTTAQVSLAVRNPLARSISLRSGKSIYSIAPGGTRTLTYTLAAKRLLDDQMLLEKLDLTPSGLGTFTQKTAVRATNGVSTQILSPVSSGLPVAVSNPSGAANSVVVALQNPSWSVSPSSQTVTFQSGETLKYAQFGVPANVSFSSGLAVKETSGSVIQSFATQTYMPFGGFASLSDATLGASYGIHDEGDANITAQYSLAKGNDVPSAIAPGVFIDPAATLKIDYAFPGGWKYLLVSPKTEALSTINGQPKALMMWAYSPEENGHYARMRFVDATGQVFQPTGLHTRWKGWKNITFPLAGTDFVSWSGANDRVIHYPIRLQNIFLYDSAGAGSGRIYFAAPTYVY